MKRFLTLVLAVVLVFAFCGAAYAFTGITEKESLASSGFTVTVELVDYQYGWKDGIYYKAPANRAYAINEVVGALITVVVPAKSNEVVHVKFSASNINILDIDADTKGLNWIDKKAEVELPANSGGSNKTYKFFLTGQLKSDKGGSITAKVVDQDDSRDIEKNGIYVTGATGLEFKVKFSGSTYTITAKDKGDFIEEDEALLIGVDRDYFCKSMKLQVNGFGGSSFTYTIATVNGKIAFKTPMNTYITSGDIGYSSLLDKLNEFLNEFGFDYNAEGYLYKSFFKALDGSVTVSDTAYVEPALPSSALQPDLTVTIPQTGSVSFAGFAMIALAVAAAVAVKKAR